MARLPRKAVKAARKIDDLTVEFAAQIRIELVTHGSR